MWTLAAGVGLGVLGCWLIGMVTGGPPEDLTEVEAGRLADEVSAVRGQAAALDEAIARLDERVSRSADLLEVIISGLDAAGAGGAEPGAGGIAPVSAGAAPAAITAPERTPVPAATTKRPQSPEQDTSWTAYLDRSIARTLIECGCTPFDTGVAPILADVTQKIAEVRREYDQRWNAFVARWPQGVDHAHREQNDAERRAVDDWFLAQRQPIIDDFRSRLLALKGISISKK